MGTHPIFESDFDCLTVQKAKKMNRLARPALQLSAISRRPLISSGKTGGHGWYREGYSLFNKHPGIFRYVGLAFLGGSMLPFCYLWQDLIYNDAKVNKQIEDIIFPAFLDGMMNITLWAFQFGIIGMYIGRILAFHNLNMWQ